MTELRLLGWGGGWGQAIAEQVLAPFTAETGVTVRQVPHVGLTLPASLDGIDVVWCNLAGAAGVRPRPFARGFEGLAPRATRRAGDGVVFAYAVPYVLCYDTRRVSRPRRWDDLFADELRGRLALYPGGNGIFPVAQVAGGGSLADLPGDLGAGWAWLRRLAPRLGVLDYSIGMEAQFRDGTTVAAYRAITNALAFARAGLPVAWTIPDEGYADTVDGFFIPEAVDASRAAPAEALIRFALRPDVQTRWCAALGARPLALEARDAGLTGGARHLAVDDALVEAHGPAWERQFTELGGRA